MRRHDEREHSDCPPYDGVQCARCTLQAQELEHSKAQVQAGWCSRSDSEIAPASPPRRRQMLAHAPSLLHPRHVARARAALTTIIQTRHREKCVG